MSILITNNPLVEAQFHDSCTVVFTDESLLCLLIRVRDRIHEGRRLLTHPLSGSVKPNETLYKSVLVSEAGNETDPQSVIIIEECLAAVRKFPPVGISDDYLPDLQAVDLSLIQSALVSFKPTTGI